MKLPKKEREDPPAFVDEQSFKHGLIPYPDIYRDTFSRGEKGTYYPTDANRQIAGLFIKAVTRINKSPGGDFRRPVAL